MGREVAEKIYERHRFFTEQLVAAGVDQETAEHDACRIEHAISDESFQKLKDAIKRNDKAYTDGLNYDLIKRAFHGEKDAMEEIPLIYGPFTMPL